MNRLYANLGHLAPTFRLAVLAAFSLAAWLICGSTVAWAECGDYVKIANPQFAGQSHAMDHSPVAMPNSRDSHSLPTTPCQGPTCGRGAPLLPLGPAPVVVRIVVDQWAVLTAEDADASLDPSADLAQCCAHPSAGFPALLERPPRA